VILSARFVQHSGLPLSFLPEVLFLFGIWIVSPFLVVQSITVIKDEGQECVRLLCSPSLQTNRTFNDSINDFNVHRNFAERASKRLTLKKKYKILRKVREHKRKVRKSDKTST